MLQKIRLLLLFLTCLTVCNGLVSQSEENNPQDQNQISIINFGSAIDQYQEKISQHSKYGDISSSLVQAGIFRDESLTKLLEVDRIKKMLEMTLNSAVNNNPTSSEEIIEQQMNDFGKVLGEMRASYQKMKHEMQKTPWNQLTEGTGTKFEDLNKQIKHLQDEAGSCEDEHIKLHGEFERTDRQNNASHRKIEDLRKSILLQENRLQKNNALINDLDQKSQEELHQMMTNFNQKQGSYQAELMSQKKAALDTSEEKIRQMDEKLVELDIKTTEVRTAENQDLSTLQAIEGEMEKIREEKKSEMQERLNTIKALDELITQSAAPSQDESMTKKERLKLLQDFEGMKNALFQENENIQSEIKDLYSEIDKIPTFTSILEVLRQRILLKKEECHIKQTNIAEKIQERDKLLVNDENQLVGALTEMDLIKGREKVLSLKNTFIASMEFALNKLENEHSELKNLLQQSNFTSLEKGVHEKPDFYLSQVYNQDSCEEGVDCLQDIFIDRLSETKFSTRIPLSTHLSAMFTRINSVDFMLKDEENALPKFIRHFMKSKLLAHKKSVWSLTSIAQSIVDSVFDANPNLFIKIREEELENEMVNMEEIYNFIRNRVRADLERFVLNRWKSKIREAIQKVSSPNMLTELSIAPSS
jgi:myosin heavy subunit